MKEAKDCLPSSRFTFYFSDPAKEAHVEMYQGLWSLLVLLVFPEPNYCLGREECGEGGGRGGSILITCTEWVRIYIASELLAIRVRVITLGPSPLHLLLVCFSIKHNAFSANIWISRGPRFICFPIHTSLMSQAGSQDYIYTGSPACRSCASTG